MILLKKTLFILTFFYLSQGLVLADSAFFLDFKYILNQSEAGKKAQVALKNELNTGIKKLGDKEKIILEEEKKIIQQKKIISAEEYKKKVANLRIKVSSLRTERNKLLDSVAKKRANARSKLLENLNPIIKEYMQEKKIRMVLDKKSLLLADENLDITNDIIKILNKKIKTIKLN